jgi:hypothetical protein
LLPDSRIALGRSNVPVSKHFTNLFQRPAVIELHARKDIAGKVGVKRPFNLTDHRKLFEIEIVAKIAVDTDQPIIDFPVSMFFVFID